MESRSYNIVVKSETGYPHTFLYTTDEDLLQRYKDCLLNQNKLFAWRDGVFNLDQVIGVYRN